MGFSALAIGNRMGHETEKITYRYAHLFPTVQNEMAEKLEVERMTKEVWKLYDNVPVKVKAELFKFSVDDFEADMKLHSLVLKELNVRMYSSELYDDYMSIVDAMDKKPVEEQNVNYYNNEKLWNRGR